MKGRKSKMNKLQEEIENRQGLFSVQEGWRKCHQ